MKKGTGTWLTQGIFVHRLLVMYVIVLGWSALILVRLLDLQVFKAEEYRDAAAQQGSGFRKLIGRRGEVFDRQLREAGSQPAREISLSKSSSHREPI